MPKSYAEPVENFICSLTSLVLLRRDAYLCHARPNLDAFRRRNLHSATISWADLFDRTLMQEYEQHLIRFGVKQDPKKTFPPLQETQEGQRWTPVPGPQDVFTNQCRHPNTWCNSLFSPPSPGWSQRRHRQLQGMQPLGYHKQ